MYLSFQIPYNLERLFWMFSNGDTVAVKKIMDQFLSTSKASVPEKICAKVREAEDLGLLSGR